ncbi:acyl-CoA N-acyltransferase [Mariannaea sp. PMI_226]|nr:acyl-CoA N-acyltransferase [Mariannaea sp. PMI_226]
MTQSDVTFRTATPDDAAQLQELVQSAFRAEDSRQDWTADMGLSASFTIDIEVILGKITQTDSEMLMAIGDDNALVACIGVNRPKPDLARLFLLAVDQRWQQGGLGRQVLAYAEDYCIRTWDVKRLGLNALSTREKLISWYERRGYQKTGELTPFPARELNGVVIPDDMCFVEMEKDAVVGVA